MLMGGEPSAGSCPLAIKTNYFFTWHQQSLAYIRLFFKAKKYFSFSVIL